MSRDAHVAGRARDLRTATQRKTHRLAIRTLLIVDLLACGYALARLLAVLP